MGIIADLVGAFATAPLVAAGTATKAAGDAVQHGASDIPSLHAAAGVVSDLGSHTLNAATNIHKSISELGDATLAALGRGMTGGFTSLTPGSMENSQTLVRAPQAPQVEVAMVTPTVKPLPLNIQDVSAADLFTNVSAQSVGTGSVNRGASVAI